eukprot:2019581-Rhodomonas_salina.1
MLLPAEGGHFAYSYFDWDGTSTLPNVLRICYAMSGTDIAYSNAEYPVLTYRTATHDLVPTQASAAMRLRCWYILSSTEGGDAATRGREYVSGGPTSCG